MWDCDTSIACLGNPDFWHRGSYFYTKPPGPGGITPQLKLFTFAGVKYSRKFSMHIVLAHFKCMPLQYCFKKLKRKQESFQLQWVETHGIAGVDFIAAVLSRSLQFSFQRWSVKVFSRPYLVCQVCDFYRNKGGTCGDTHAQSTLYIGCDTVYKSEMWNSVV